MTEKVRYNSKDKEIDRMTDRERGFYERNISYIRAVLFEDLNVLL